MAFDQDLLFEFTELIYGDVEAALKRSGAGNRGGTNFSDVGALRGFCPSWKRLTSEISREAYAGHQDDRSLIAGSIGQLGGRSDERSDRHRGLSAAATGGGLV